MNKLEISVSNIEEAIIAEKGGADSLELAIKSERGGLTPSLIQISEILTQTKLPCYILIRPRLDSYNLTEEEFTQLLHLVEIAKMIPVKGISIGLLKDGKIDREKLDRVIAIKGRLELVFNHAIDSVFNYETDLEYLISHDGVDWIQTTGSSETIIDGYKRILPYMDSIRNKLIVGRAINLENIYELLEADLKGIVYQCKSSLVVNDEFDGEILSLEKVREFSEILKGEKDE